MSRKQVIPITIITVLSDLGLATPDAQNPMPLPKGGPHKAIHIGSPVCVCATRSAANSLRTQGCQNRPLFRIRASTVDLKIQLRLCSPLSSTEDFLEGPNTDALLRYQLLDRRSLPANLLNHTYTLRCRARSGALPSPFCAAMQWVICGQSATRRAEI
jgi:hypothetical protein